MISSQEALQSPKSKLSDAELKIFSYGEAIIDATLRDQYTGLPCDFPMLIEEVPARVVYALKRRYEKPAPDGSRWRVTVLELRNEGKLIGHKFAMEPAPPADFIVKDAPVSEVRSGNIAKQLFEELATLHGYSASATGVKLADKPKLSILFGTYNRIDCLKGVVESIRKSVEDITYEIICVDGGSSDGTRAWLGAQNDIIFIGERVLSGAVKAFNQAYALCRGEYIANLNDDCLCEGNALAEGVRYLEKHPNVGQVAFGFNTVEGDIKVNRVYPKVPWATEYANFGIARREATEQVVAIQGGFWNSCYRTYGADVEFSAWLHKLGWKVAPLSHLHISDTRIEDPLRKKNAPGSGIEAKRMGMRWPAEAFKPDGSDPKVSKEELARFYAVRDAKNGVVSKNLASASVVNATSTWRAPESKIPDDKAAIAILIDWPEPQEEARLQKIASVIRTLDPVEGRFPTRAEKLGPERVLHVSLVTKADPQAGLVRALKQMGLGGYSQIDWLDHEHDERQKLIILEAAALRPTFVFCQLQAPNAVDVETVKEIRRVAPDCIIATWSGDIADVNSPYNVDWQVSLGRVVDLTMHSSFSHVKALRAAGIHNSGFFQIGYDSLQYRLPNENEIKYEIVDGQKTRVYDYDVCFLGSRYGGNDSFSKSMKHHDAKIRDEAVVALKKEFGSRFGLFGNGWSKFLAEQGIEHVDQVVPLDKAHEIYWRSKTALNVSLSNELECYSSDRLHRILGCGTLALVKPFPLSSVWGLVHDTNCLMWDKTEDLVALAKTKNDERYTKLNNAIAERGASLAQKHLTWETRALEMQAYLDAIRKNS